MVGNIKLENEKLGIIKLCSIIVKTIKKAN
jgi:hypothetical protein